MVLADFADYRRAKKHLAELYNDKKTWNRMSLMNTSGAGVFAADRAINDYARDIWHTKSAFAQQAKSAVKKPASKKAEPAKAETQKPADKNAAAKKPATVKAPEKKAPAKKTATKKTEAKKAPAKKTAKK